MQQLFSRLRIGEIARRHPLTYFDIGSRGGFQDDLHPIAFAVDAVGFEPEAFVRLREEPSAPWRSRTHLPFGVSERTGARVLHVPVDPQSASLLEPDAEIGRRFHKSQFFDIARTATVETLSLGDALREAGLGAIDYVKIDIEGAELAVLGSAPDVLSHILAIKTEVSFMRFRKNQPLASEIDLRLRESGFELMGLSGRADWRRHGYLVDPYYAADAPSYSKGQIAQADQLYFRRADTMVGETDKLLKLSLIAMSFGYFDHALMILETPSLAMPCAPSSAQRPCSSWRPRRRSTDDGPSGADSIARRAAWCRSFAIRAI